MPGQERRRRAPEEQEEMEEEVDADVPVDASLLHHDHGHPKRTGVERVVKYLTDRIWSFLFFGSATYGCIQLDLVPEALYSPHVKRNMMHLCVLSVTLAMGFGCYIELYRSMWRKEKVSYQTVKTSTRGLVLSMFLTGIFFVVALWPVWGWLTMPFAFMAFFGVFMQMLVIFPPAAQRVIIGVGYTAFMYTYVTTTLT